jgi:hypothetical protein
LNIDKTDNRPSNFFLIRLEPLAFKGMRLDFVKHILRLPTVNLTFRFDKKC